MSERLAELQRWLRDGPGITAPQLQPASADASFRRYFRLMGVSPTLIAMDAPPPQEDCRPFVTLAGLFGDLGLNVPRVLDRNLERGFLLLSDLGNETYLRVLDADNADRLYGDALDALMTLQSAPIPDYAFPEYDRPMLMREMGLFREWYLEKHLGLAIDGAGEAAIDAAFALLADTALQQPRVCVHRDFHSRNLMWSSTGSDNPGILDFQDAVVGPLTYDLVSLLRDCYIDWPRPRVEAWAEAYRRCALANGLLPVDDAGQFMTWFDLMGMQRHLKAVGIFARLYRRDGKPGYLGDIPRTLGYVREVAARIPALAEFSRWLELELGPVLQRESRRAPVPVPILETAAT
jgi:aminoglycoside/choline kinase family phosphotransferase